MHVRQTWSTSRKKLESISHTPWKNQTSHKTRKKPAIAVVLCLTLVRMSEPGAFASLAARASMQSIESLGIFCPWTRSSRGRGRKADLREIIVIFNKCEASVLSCSIYCFEICISFPTTARNELWIIWETSFAKQLYQSLFQEMFSLLAPLYRRYRHVGRGSRRLSWNQCWIFRYQSDDQIKRPRGGRFMGRDFLVRGYSGFVIFWFLDREFLIQGFSGLGIRWFLVF